MPRPTLPPNRPRRFRRATALAGAAAVLLLARCDAPQSPAPGRDAAYQGAFDGVVLEFRLEQGSGTSPLQLVARDLAYDAATEILTAQVALRNTSRVAVPGPAWVTVWDFDPPSVQPENAACTECLNCVVMCSFDHSGSYGDDGLLGPGETSEPRPWAFHDAGPQSFAFRARIESDPTPQPGGFISGVIFLDQDADGERDPSDPGMPGRPVELHFGDLVSTTQSGEDGRYRFEVGEPGLYVVALVPTDFCLETTPTHRNVLIVRQPDGTLSGYDGADFGCRGEAPPDSNVAVHGIVFEDLDRDGQRDRGERGLPGVLVVGSVPSCPTFAPIETHTDSNGTYAMVLPGCVPPYVVHREPLPGFADTTPNPLVFARQAPVLEANFGVAPVPENGLFIEGIVFDDRDGDGAPDPDEPPFAGVEVWASGYRCLLPVVALGRTDAQGRYRLRGADVLCELPWIVHRAPIPRHCDTTPNPVVIDGAPGDPPVFHVDFGARACDNPAPTIRAPARR